MLNLDTFTDLTSMLEVLWPNGESDGNIGRVFCKITSRSTARGEDFEEEMKVLFDRLESIEGWVDFPDDDHSLIDGG